MPLLPVAPPDNLSLPLIQGHLDLLPRLAETSSVLSLLLTLCRLDPLPHLSKDQ